MEQGSDLYLTIKTLHILSAIVGFGAVMLNGLYGARSKAAQGPSGLAIFDANHFVSHHAAKAIYLVFLLGFILVLGEDGPEFGDTWVWLAMTIYAIAISVSHGVMNPTLKKMREKMAELVEMGPPQAGAAAAGPPPQVADLEALGKRVAMTGAFLNVMVVVMLYLMVFQPIA